MRWRKLGRLYEPPGTLRWARTHGQVPFAQPIDDTIVRIFFTPKDAHHRSHIAVMTLDLRRSHHARVQQEPVLRPGRRGTFDDDGAMMGCVVGRDGDARAYYQGWNPGGTVSFRTAIGVASIADDVGIVTFRRWMEGPVLDRGPNEAFFVGTPFVLSDAGTWHMWYTSGTGWDDEGEPLYGIRHATSRDGFAWSPDRGLCLAPIEGNDTMLTRPSVIRDGQIYRMWYSARRTKGPYRIGYAESRDGAAWVRRDDEAGISVSEQGWDSEMVCYPHVFDGRDGRYMLYCGNAFGRAGFGIAIMQD
jgi:hypothetical protein